MNMTTDDLGNANKMFEHFVAQRTSFACVSALCVAEVKAAFVFGDYTSQSFFAVNRSAY